MHVYSAIEPRQVKEGPSLHHSRPRHRLRVSAHLRNSHRSLAAEEDIGNAQIEMRTIITVITVPL